MTIIPAILSDSTETIQSQLDRVQNETELTRVQVDIVDAEFSDETTVSPIDLLQFHNETIDIDIHLMTNDPINDVVECSQVPHIRGIIAQIEHMSSQHAFVEHVKSYNLRVGLSIDLTTPIEELDPQVLGSLDMIQVMDIQAGAQGRPFGGEKALKHIREIKQVLEEKGLEHIEVLADGGINTRTEIDVIDSGADALVVGSALWNATDLQEAIEKLQRTA
ncbi:hypothetical protein C5B42_01985 [Candidatus Cerribacteria bacterium 'Amazon FNV 2010 28 9']|uniref:Ribulose-phosphate 3-epimerase n=1 Tax=Candidatus Cerribacteria bacterium 'Amazon FNV 2010 28 9' TaxID=2081795 RepID=A0A317JUL1_9BACT|nr:MAG: hypothetical protein C5B42_01985 [Candidatus Cerribacteria bacterium 'Amazon FNV 2010 28 9']